MNQKFSKLTSATFDQAVEYLVKIDENMADAVGRIERPKQLKRPAGFSTLLHIILEQQVSLASAQSTFDKLNNKTGTINPVNFLQLDDVALKAVGFSRQKTSYCRHLAEALISGRLNLEALAHKQDDEVRAELTKIKGIGLWTADVYLMMVLARADIWPIGDLALQISAQKIKQLESRPSPDQLLQLGEQWRPHRTVAAHILWYDYLNDRKAKT
ncbi:MAG: DNA-3-methyladenine glycosylase 2 family protein [Proteobacteria bacterium]|nr:DNA-3-methyladenine glycosylase 2 family protein [Pseudomonadota bacterium]